MIEERTAPIMDDLRDSYHDELIRLRSENKRQKDLLSLAVGKLETVINKASILKREREREREGFVGEFFGSFLVVFSVFGSFWQFKTGGRR